MLHFNTSVFRVYRENDVFSSDLRSVRTTVAQKKYATTSQQKPPITGATHLMNDLYKARSLPDDYNRGLYSVECDCYVGLYDPLIFQEDLEGLLAYQIVDIYTT